MPDELSSSVRSSTSSSPGGRVTLADIARVAGVSRAAVSYALRGGKGTSPKTQERIRRIARDLGYRPDPELTRLMMHLHTGRMARRGSGAARFAGKLALINPHSEQQFTKQAAAVADFFRGVSGRAGELGYETEEFWLWEPGRSPKRLAQMLMARGIQGVVLGSTARHGSVVEFPWENFAAVTVGYTVAKPVLHRVVTHHYRNTRLALAQAMARGWCRIGLVVTRESEAVMEDLHLAAFARHLDSTPEGDRVPALVFEKNKVLPEAVRAWWEKHRPEVVLTTDLGLASMERAGLRVPQDVQWVKLLLWDEREGAAGVLPGYDRLGTVAADMLAGQLAHGELGLPKEPQVVLVEGRWQEGTSLGTKA